MAKPKNLEQLRAEKEQVETQLAQEQHKLERLENRKKYLEKGERQKRTHRLCNLGGTIESLCIYRSVAGGPCPYRRKWNTNNKCDPERTSSEI